MKRIILGGLIAVVVLGPIALFAVDFGRVELMSKVAIYLTQRHYSPGVVDNDFSASVFDRYLKRIDPSKQFFIQPDIEVLSQYRELVDDDVLKGSANFYGYVEILFNKRVKQVSRFYGELLDKPFDFNKDDRLETDPDKIRYVNDIEALKDRWRLVLKYRTMSNYITLVQIKNKVAGDKASTSNEMALIQIDKVDPEIEAEAREKTREAVERRLDRMLIHGEDDHFSDFFDVVLSDHDPHTNYLPPSDKADFDIGITGRLEGIGALLREEDGFIKVVRLIPGSAAWRQKQLEAEDIILKVGQENEPPVDVVDMRVSDAVLLIRGKKGTQVNLTVQKADGRIEIIPIVRDVVVIEDSYARGAIFDSTENDLQLGYIYLPGFYRDFDNPSARNSSDDIRKILKQMQQIGTDGIVVDLRNNGGGALEDAVKITGLFIEEGPVVQERSGDGSVRILPDEDARVHYDKPVVVMINRYSASASEIVAAALQDYKRAVIVGSDHSFGKGTVQTLVNLDHFFSWFGRGAPKSLGSAKLTIKKFYRINGGSTQEKGVESDVVMPDIYDFVKTGEKELEKALPWDTIAPLKYDTFSIDESTIKQLKNQSHDRVRYSQGFTKISAYIEKLERRQEDTVQTLNLKEAVDEQNDIRSSTKEIDNLVDIESHFNFAILDDKESDKSKAEERKSWKEDWREQINDDIVLLESLNILQDLVQLR